MLYRVNARNFTNVNALDSCILIDSFTIQLHAATSPMNSEIDEINLT